MLPATVFKRFSSRVVATCVGIASLSSTAMGATLRVGAPLGHATSLADLWNRPASVMNIQVAPAVATAVPAGKHASVAAQSPFATRLAALRAAQNPAAGRLMQTERTAIGARLAALRALQGVATRGPALDPRAEAARMQLEARSPDLQIAWDRGRAIFFSGSDLGNSPVEFFSVAGPLLGLDRAEVEMQLQHEQVDALGMRHARYQQTFEAHAVWGRELIVHSDARGHVVCVGGRVVPSPRPLAGVQARISAADAVRLAARPSGTNLNSTTPELVVYVQEAGTCALAYRLRVAAALDHVDDVFVDAVTGGVLHRVSVVASDGPVTGSGVDLLGASRSLNLYQIGSTYFNINTAKPMYNAAGSNLPQTVKGGIRVFDAQHGQGDQLAFSTSSNPNDWSGKAGHVSAAANASIVYDYYNQRHARNSIDGNGGTMEAVVNFNNNFNNAFWNGQFMVFGNGDGSHFSDLAAALDVTAHEMTHGVVEHTANLVYETQSGALNESFADVFGACTEWFARPSTGNWLVGEEVTTPGTAGDALRNMQDPAAANVAFNGQQPTTMSQFQNLPNDDAHDHGGVHANSGIPNRAFYLVATSTALGATNAERIGKAERIYYRALANYLTRTAQFIDCRLGVIRAAEDLYGGAGNPVALACAQAFTTVEIGDDDPSGPPPTLPPVVGTQYIAVTDAATGRLARATTDFGTIIGLSSGPISNKPAIPDNGDFAIFIDNSHKLRFVNSDGTGEAFLSEAPVWRSIAVAPDGNTLAATSTALDDTVYVLDLNDGRQDRAFAIHAVNYGGEGDDAAQFADFLDFSNDGQYVLYDCLNRKTTANGPLEYWDINLLRASDGAVQRVFPPQQPGINIGNPTFSPLSDYVMALDYVDEQGNVSVLGADLEHGEVGLITNNFASPGRPSFSPDAHNVVYHYIDSQGASIWTVTLQADGITGAGDDVQRVNGGFDPTWFAIGTRPAVVLAGLSATSDGERATLQWEATADAAHDHFRVLRDAGSGWEPRSGALREPASPGSGSDRWEFMDVLTDLPARTSRLRYGIEAVERDGTAVLAGSIELDLTTVVARRTMALLPNVPNPFNPTTVVRFTVGGRQHVELGLYDAAGRRVRALWSGSVETGTHQRTWDGKDDAGKTVASGTYFLRLVGSGQTRTRSVTMVR